MNHRVEVSSEATSNYWELYEFIAEQSPQGAHAWAEALKQSLESLQRQPLACSIAPENDDHDAEIRQFFFRTRHGRTYRGLIWINELTVYVLHLRGPGQDLISPDDFQLPH